MNSKKQTIAVGMSGGVDSTVTALLLLQKGYNVIGLTMKIWDGEPAKEDSGCHSCYGADEIFDIEDAKKTAKQLGIKLHIIDLAKEYKEVVLNYFRKEYLSGRTPNPCVVCNPKMKFGLLVDTALKSGIDFDLFATGHYARVEFEKKINRYLLKRAKYIEKDQSYFIYSLNQKQLARTIFPIGDLSKQEVRNIAKANNLNVADRPESQDFISDSNYDILFDKNQIKEGNIIDTNGNILGKHKGIINYTIGQRKGLGISSKNPVFVLNINALTNEITVGAKDKSFSDTLIADNLNWIPFEKLEKPIDCMVKIRQKHKESKAKIMPIENDNVLVSFEESQFAITPGQATVFYDGDIVLGGGTIKETKNAV